LPLDEVERVRHLKRSFRVSAVKIALLVADICNDLHAKCRFDLGAPSRLAVLHAAVGVAAQE
jgi:hypothetical protein